MPVRVFRLLINCSLSLFLAGCFDAASVVIEEFVFPVSQTEPCPPGKRVSLVDAKTLRICGSIDWAVFEDVHSLNASNEIEAIVIDSFGGEIEASIKIAELIWTNNLPVFVNHLCMSACAQYILLAAPRIYTRHDSLILMHDTQTATNILTKNIGRRPNVDYWEELERNLHSKIGANEELLLITTASLEIKCALDMPSYLDSGVLNFVSRFDFVMPDSDDAKRIFGNRLRSRWPNEKMVRRKLASMRTNPLRVRYGFDPGGLVVPLKECDS